MEFVEALEADNFVSVDEMSANPEQFKDRYAYAPEGQPAVVWEWGMGGGGVLSVVAAYTVYGFTAWRFFNCNINQYGVQHFSRSISGQL